MSRSKFEVRCIKKCLHLVQQKPGVENLTLSKLYHWELKREDVYHCFEMYLETIEVSMATEMSIECHFLKISQLHLSPRSRNQIDTSH